MSKQNTQNKESRFTVRVFRLEMRACPDEVLTFWEHPWSNEGVDLEDELILGPSSIEDSVHLIAECAGDGAEADVKLRGRTIEIRVRSNRWQQFHVMAKKRMGKAA
jgi:hypothetical protein